MENPALLLLKVRSSFSNRNPREAGEAMQAAGEAIILMRDDDHGTERTERKEGRKRKLNERENEVKTSSVVDFVPAVDMAKSRQEDLD